MIDYANLDKVVRQQQLVELQATLDALTEQVAELVEQHVSCIHKMEKIMELIGEQT